MSQEIIEAVREIERDKGIEEGALVSALEDALLAAYKKTPGAARHATVELDDAGDFRVFSIKLPRTISSYGMSTSPAPSTLSVSASAPASFSSPLNFDRPPTGSRVRSDTRRPSAWAKCAGLRSGRSIPGDDTSTVYSRR